MIDHTPPTEQQLDDIARMPRAEDIDSLLAEVRYLRARAREYGALAARRESELIARRSELEDLQAENSKLIRWHTEDETAMKRMRATITRLRDQLAASVDDHREGHTPAPEAAGARVAAERGHPAPEAHAAPERPSEADTAPAAPATETGA